MNISGVEATGSGRSRAEDWSRGGEQRRRGLKLPAPAHCLLELFSFMFLRVFAFHDSVRSAQLK